MKIEVNSAASAISDSTRLSGFNFSSIMNSIQKPDSSVSSITMLNFEVNATLLCARHAAL